MSMETRLPLKVVPPMESDYYHPDSGGGGDKIFSEPTREFRDSLIEQLVTIQQHFADTFKEHPSLPAVARVRLRPDAAAKSHRPTRIFSEDSCPIIGSEGLGSLLVSVTPRGLDTLAHRIERDKTIKGRANLSTLLSLLPFTPTIEMPEDPGLPLKVKLFRHHLAGYDRTLDVIFHHILGRFKGTADREVNYGPGLKVFRISSCPPEIIQAISSFVGTQSVGGFPLYKPVRTQSIPVGLVTPRDFPPPDPTVDYPVVGVIDTGTRNDDPLLSPWILDREAYVPGDGVNHGHGTFVSGLIIHSQRLNHGDVRFPGCSSKILDVVAIPESGISEDELLTILEDILPKYQNVKFWNLSIGTSNAISDDMFSDFAVAIDRLQQQHQVVFILAAGNCRNFPLRTWPPEEDVHDDRICSPADSVRSIVVGAVAHTHTASTASRDGDPSPFSRKGPGPVYLPKPDLSHFGGNCKADGSCSQTGVMSLDGLGNLVEDIGTSFAAPLVTTLAANIANRIHGGGSPNLTKALLIHSSALSSEISDSAMLHYRGFGTPPDPEIILSCQPWMSTLIFELPIHAGIVYHKMDFPIPPSLLTATRTIRANILMTLVYDPDLDASFGSEYCRSNIEASLGTLERDSKGKLHHNKQVPEDPKLRGSAYEQDLVKHGFKWSPVKVYRRKMTRGPGQFPWRLAISITHRAGVELFPPQPAALVITVSDPDKRAPVYNEMVTMMSRLGWGAYDLQITSRARL